MDYQVWACRLDHYYFSLGNIHGLVSGENKHLEYVLC